MPIRSVVYLSAVLSLALATTVTAGPPAARLPAPTPQQVAWQDMEITVFIHFGVNTFTNREWGEGTEDPKVFNPTKLDARQWVRAAKAGGAGMVILTAKHHDGFCLWPSKYTEHSVKNSPWRDGKGDVVRELADACRAEGVKLGLYLSPWDRHEKTYGDSPKYNQHYLNQLTELLRDYGPIAEVWFDGACGEGPNGKRQVYDWPAVHATVRKLQPEAVMFSDAGPDVRWIGNESGIAGDPCWSMIDPARVPYAGFSGPGVGDVLQHGDPNGSLWRPGECDVSIRPGWFWHKEPGRQGPLGRQSGRSVLPVRRPQQPSASEPSAEHRRAGERAGRSGDGGISRAADGDLQDRPGRRKARHGQQHPRRQPRLRAATGRGRQARDVLGHRRRREGRLA